MSLPAHEQPPRRRFSISRETSGGGGIYNSTSQPGSFRRSTMNFQRMSEEMSKASSLGTSPIADPSTSVRSRVNKPRQQSSSLATGGPNLSFEKRKYFDKEDPEVVKRHLVSNFTKSLEATVSTSKAALQGVDGPPSGEQSRGASVRVMSPDPEVVGDTTNNVSLSLPVEEFSSLKTQGGDTTRPLYKWLEEQENNNEADGNGTIKRSASFSHYAAIGASSEGNLSTAREIRLPGGFRREYILAKNRGTSQEDSGDFPENTFVARNFLHFLTLYGHFAGEDLEEWDDSEEEAILDLEAAADVGGEEGERRPLLTRSQSRRYETKAKASVTKAVLLLLKSFVGTGVLFLPKAFKNGGILFSSLVLVLVAVLSLICFFQLISVRGKHEGSYGYIGDVLFGRWMRFAILGSIAISQIGFVCAYMIFTAESLRAFTLAVTDCATDISVPTFIVIQMVVFLPLAMIRKIHRLSGTALVADLFIFLGLIYLYYSNIVTIQTKGFAEVALMNSKDFPLFIGTAIFTFEGIGLIIPITESMREPQKFPYVLSSVMAGITVIFVSMGALGYLTYGKDVQTVVLLNLPQDDKFVNAVQFFYSVAILLSTPLQLFPAIRILENSVFSRSGKFNPQVKWEKNGFRFLLVVATAIISGAGADDLDKFVALTGSFACIPLVYIYPPMLYLKSGPPSKFHKAGSWVLLVFGIFAMCYTTISTIKSWATSKGTPYKLC